MNKSQLNDEIRNQFLLYGKFLQLYPNLQQRAILIGYSMIRQLSKKFKRIEFTTEILQYFCHNVEYNTLMNLDKKFKGIEVRYNNSSYFHLRPFEFVSQLLTSLIKTDQNG